MLTVKQIYKDDVLLPEFIERCKEKGFANNSSIESLKFDYFEESAFFATVEDNKISSFSGIHNFDFDNQRFYRIGFRGAAIYREDTRPVFNKNFLISSPHYGIIFPLQILHARKYFKTPNSKFVVTTNPNVNQKDTAGRSFNMDKFAKKGLMPGLSLLYENITYLYSIQNVWLVDPNVFINSFNTHYKGKVEILC